MLIHRSRNFLCLVLLALMLSGCADDKAVVLGPQQWEDLVFKIETRPSPLRVGMNEFIVIASWDEYKPGVDLVVDLKVGKNGQWRQAIQDGFTGVYRRAVQVDDPQTQTLTVRVNRTRKDDGTVMYFPLNQKPGKAH